MRPDSSASAEVRRADASMSLLVDLWTNALDPGYAASRGEPRRSSARRAVPLAVGLVAASFLVVIAAVQAHARAPAAARAHDRLVAQVQQESKAVADLSAQVDRLRAATGALRDSSLQGSAAGAALSTQLAQSELAAGTVAVTGPGLRVTLNDAPTTGAGQGNQGQGNRVEDRDLQSVVNALWAAGAEAIAINDQRLTGQSSIRAAGDAILVDFQPLRPPYVVQAIGDPVGMETTFAQSAAAARMRSYVQLYGLRFAYARASSLDVPAGVEEQLHDARPVHEPSSDRPTPNEKGSG